MKFKIHYAIIEEKSIELEAASEGDARRKLYTVEKGTVADPGEYPVDVWAIIDGEPVHPIIGELHSGVTISLPEDCDGDDWETVCAAIEEMLDKHNKPGDELRVDAFDIGPAKVNAEVTIMRIGGCYWPLDAVSKDPEHHGFRLHYNAEKKVLCVYVVDGKLEHEQAYHIYLDPKEANNA